MNEKVLILQDTEISSVKLLVSDTRNITVAAIHLHNTCKECEVNKSYRLQHSRLTILHMSTDQTRPTNAGHDDFSNIKLGAKFHIDTKWRICFSNILERLLCVVKRDPGSSYVSSLSRSHHIVTQQTHMSSTDQAKAMRIMICQGI